MLPSDLLKRVIDQLDCDEPDIIAIVDCINEQILPEVIRLESRDLKSIFSTYGGIGGAWHEDYDPEVGRGKNKNKER